MIFSFSNHRIKIKLAFLDGLIDLLLFAILSFSLIAYEMREGYLHRMNLFLARQVSYYFYASFSNFILFKIVWVLFLFLALVVCLQSIPHLLFKKPLMLFIQFCLIIHTADQLNNPIHYNYSIAFFRHCKMYAFCMVLA